MDKEAVALGLRRNRTKRVLQDRIAAVLGIETCDNGHWYCFYHYELPCEKSLPNTQTFFSFPLKHAIQCLDSEKIFKCFSFWKGTLEVQFEMIILFQLHHHHCSLVLWRTVYRYLKIGKYSVKSYWRQKVITPTCEATESIMGRREGRHDRKPLRPPDWRDSAGLKATKPTWLEE